MVSLEVGTLLVFCQPLGDELMKAQIANFFFPWKNQSKPFFHLCSYFYFLFSNQKLIVLFFSHKTLEDKLRSLEEERPNYVIESQIS